MKLFLTSLSLLVVGFTYAKESNSGLKEDCPEIPPFVEARIVSPISMTVGDLPTISWGDWRDRINDGESEVCLVYTHEPPVGMSDGFTHKVFVEAEQEEYWILRYGGITGAYEVFGPGSTTEPLAEQVGAGNPGKRD